MIQLDDVTVRAGAFALCGISLAIPDRHVGDIATRRLEEGKRDGIHRGVEKWPRISLAQRRLDGRPILDDSKEVGILDGHCKDIARGASGL